MNTNEQKESYVPPTVKPRRVSAEMAELVAEHAKQKTLQGARHHNEAIELDEQHAANVRALMARESGDLVAKERAEAEAAAKVEVTP